MHSEICPVCNGVGKVSAGFYNRGGDCPPWISSGVDPEVCRSCNGKGYVVTPDYNPEYYRGSGYQFVDRCPSCGGDRNSPALTGCPKGNHYGSSND